jgi:hypothetical protein
VYQMLLYLLSHYDRVVLVRSVGRKEPLGFRADREVKINPLTLQLNFHEGASPSLQVQK